MSPLPEGVTEQDIAIEIAFDMIELMEYLPDSMLATLYLEAEAEAYDRKLTTEEMRRVQR